MRIFFYIFLLILFSCVSFDNTILVTNSGEAQGSYYHIKYMSNDGEDYSFQIDSIFKEVDSSLSVYKDYSLISKLNRGEELKIDTLFNAVFLAAQQVFFESEGSFDCSIFPLVDTWGFYKHNLGDSLKIDSVRVRRILDDVGFQKVHLIGDSLVMPKNMCLDFNSIGQGFTVDLIGLYLEKKLSEVSLILPITSLDFFKLLLRSFFFILKNPFFQ